MDAVSDVAMKKYMSKTVHFFFIYYKYFIRMKKNKNLKMK